MHIKRYPQTRYVPNNFVLLTYPVFCNSKVSVTKDNESSKSCVSKQTSILSFQYRRVQLLKQGKKQLNMLSLIARENNTKRSVT